MFNIHSIKTKLVAVLAIIMGLLLLGQLLFIIPIMKKDVLTDAGVYQAQTAHQLADMLDMSFDEAAKELEDISKKPDIVSMDKKRIGRAFQNIKSISLFFEGFSVYNARKENIYISDNFSPGGKYELPKATGESKFTAESKIYFSGIFNSTGDEPDCLFVTPVYSKGGKTEGFLAGVYSVSQKKNILNRVVNTKIGKRGHTYIISAEDGIVVFPEKSKAEINPESIYENFIAAANSFDLQDRIIEYDCNNTPWIAAFSPVKQAGLYVVSHQPKEDIIKEANRETAFIINGFVFALIICAVIITVIIQVAFRPLNNILENIKSGKFQTAKKYPKHEVGQLAKEFDSVYSNMLQSDKELRESEARFRELANLLPESVFEMDTDGRLTFANKSAFDNFGYSEDDLKKGLNAFDMLIPEERERALNNAMKMLNGEKPEENEYTALRKDGSTFPLLLRVAPILSDKGPGGFRGVVINISDRIKAESVLRESEAKYRSILENMEEVFYEVNMKGDITYVNDAAEKMLGYTKDELIGMNNRAYTSPETAKRMFEIFNKVYRTGEPSKINDYEIITKDGGTKLLELSTFIAMDQDGNKTGFRGLIRDVSERVRAEKEKKKLEAQFYQAQKMEAIGTLAGGIAHDINNILMGIQGNASIVLMDIDSSAPHYEKLKNIEEYVVSGSNLTKQLLGFARSGKYNVKAADLNELVEKTSGMFGRTKKEIRINTRFQEEIWLVEVDQSQIEQVLLNIYVNAWQAMPAGGDLYLDVKNIIIDEEYVKTYRINPGKYVRISITDTGIGMDASIRQRIFDPFFTTKEMGRGTGLGLASAYGIIKNHGGFINVYSEIGKGTTFNIYLPVSDKKEINETAQSVEKIIRGSGTILFIDDEEMIIKLGKEILEKLGYKVLLASGGLEAIEIYKKSKSEINLVILDMIMPDLSGNVVFEKMKEINPDVKVLLSSGYSINGQAAEIIKKGCCGFIQKPFNIVKLSNIIDQIITKDPVYKVHDIKGLII